MTILKELKAPVFNEEKVGNLNLKGYSVLFEGHAKKPARLMMEEFFKLPQTTLDMRMTSVSGWSVRANWNGVLWKDMITYLKPIEDYNFVIFESVGGYTTNVYKEDVLADKWLFCHSVEGERLEEEYGGPLRMLIPNLWGYKSCKWLTKVTFSKNNVSGFWETHGYDDRGLIEAGETLDINTGKRRVIKGGEVTEF